MPTARAAWRALLKADQRRLKSRTTASPERLTRLQKESDAAREQLTASLEHVEMATRYKR